MKAQNLKNQSTVKFLDRVTKSIDQQPYFAAGIDRRSSTRYGLLSCSMIISLKKRLLAEIGGEYTRIALIQVQQRTTSGRICFVQDARGQPSSRNYEQNGWVYKFGPSQPVYTVLFKDGKVAKILEDEWGDSEKEYLQCNLVAITIYAVRNPNQIRCGFRESPSWRIP